VITCEQCAYWEPPKGDTEERLGECRRSPPVHEFWPVTLPADWCGQAVPRDAGGAMAVVTEAQALVDEFEREHRVTSNSVWALRDALERMKP
jgi:hypothetical protein